MTFKVDNTTKEIWESKYPEVREKLKSFCHKICFYQFVKRHPDLKQFLQDVNSITMDKIYHLHKKIMTFDGDLSLFKDPELHLIAVAAYKRKIFDKHLTTTILHFKSVLDDPRIGKSNLKACCVFKDVKGIEVNPESERILREAEARDIDVIKSRSNETIQLTKPKLLNEFWGQFVIEVRKRPRFEWYFLTCGDYDSQSKMYFFENKTITKRIMSIGFNEFNRFRFGEKDVGCIIASVGMMQGLATAAYKNNAPRLDPVLGSCPNSDIDWDGLHDTRKFGVQIPGARQPKTADGYESEGWEFGFHDGVYHLNKAGAVPSRYRKKYVQLSLFLRMRGIDKTKEGEALCERLSDMEHTTYDPEKMENLEYLFWDRVIQYIENKMVKSDEYEKPLSKNVLACIHVCCDFILQDKINASSLIEILDDLFKKFESLKTPTPGKPLFWQNVAIEMKSKINQGLKHFFLSVTFSNSIELPKI